jgi:DNA repair protein SbcC/Rad50
MKIDKLSINNFKNYEGQVTFDLSKQVTVLHGDNGFGKSSFFDAIEWCLTNKIERFNGTEAEIKRDIINRNCKSEKFQVLVCVEFGGNQITRSFKVTNGEIGKTQVKMVDKEGILHRGQENVENIMKSTYFKDTGFSKGTYGQLIKKTYILSQDQITDFVTSQDSEERYRALANILGLKTLLNESDNAKKILAALKAEGRKYDIDLKEFDDFIKSKNETKQVIDIFDLNSNLINLGINNKDNLEMQCKELQKELNEKRGKIKNFIELYNNLKLGEFNSINEIINQISKNDYKQKEYKERVENGESLLLKVEERILGLQKEKKHLKKYNDIRIKIKQNQDYLIVLNIDKDKNNIDDINKELNLLRNKALKLEYIISIQQSLASNLKKTKDIMEENEFLEKEINLLTRKNIKYKELYNLMEQRTNKSKNKLLLQLISNVKDIREYVKVNNLDECPVCSSIPEPQLKDRIDKNIILLNNQIQEDTKYVEKCMNLIRKINNKVQFFEEETTRIKTKFKSNTMLVQRLKEELENYKANALFDEVLIKNKENDLKNDLQKTRDNINTFQKAIETILNLESLYDELKYISNINKQKSIIPQKENDIEVILKRFLRAEKRIERNIIKYQSLIKDIKTIENKLEMIMQRLSDFIPNDQFNYNLREIYNTNIENLKGIEFMIENISNISEVLVTLRINSEIDNQVKDIKAKRSRLINKKRKLNNVIIKLEDYINQKIERFGNGVKDFLNKDNSSIQRYFRYLNPLPSNSLLRFDGEDEKLNIKVEFESDGLKEGLVTNAKNVLSSGQLNVLAISIFLAINEGQKTHSLDFVAIDDPIQNMDDINQYSICDILGKIKKQLFFSTHDVEFLKLFIKKNSYRIEDIQVYSFTSPYLNQQKVKEIALN